MSELCVKCGGIMTVISSGENWIYMGCLDCDTTYTIPREITRNLKISNENGESMSWSGN